MMKIAQVVMLLYMVQYSSQHGNGHYHNAAVATDVPQCSEMGKSILEEGGSAVDAAITSLLCVSVVDPQSSGFGGGLSMVVYIDKKAEALMSVEKAPLAANPYMLPKGELFGAKAIAVPTQLSGLWAAHERYGRLPWKRLFEPVIEIARNGHTVTWHLVNALNLISDDHPEISDMFRDKDGNLPKEGDTKTSPAKLVDTLETIADNGPWEFYMGRVGKAMIKDIQDKGGVITKEDFCPCNTKGTWKPVTSTTFKNGLSMYSTPHTGGGSTLQYLLNVLDEYNITSESIETPEKKLLLYHRFIEATKFARGLFNDLGDDPKSATVKKVLSAMNSKQFAQETRANIHDEYAIPYGPNNRPSPVLAAAIAKDQEELQVRGYVIERRATSSGDTTHVSVLAANGDAVSVTASVGNYFGSMIYSESTGVFLNNHINNFLCPGFETHPNGIQPGRRILTGTAPTILVDSDLNVKMVIGSSGSFLIIPTNAWVILRTLWTGSSLEQAIDEKRIYANKDYTSEEAGGIDNGDIQNIRKGLVKMGHTILDDTKAFAVIQAILKDEGGITAYSDKRKGGWAAGY